MKRKLLSMFLAFSMVLVPLSVPAFAEENDNSGADAATVTYDDKNCGTVEGYAASSVVVNTEMEAVAEGNAIKIPVTKVSVTPGSVIPFSQKNESIGRNRDGWWVGIKITAPENCGNLMDVPNDVTSSQMTATPDDGRVQFRNNNDYHDRYWKMVLDGSNYMTGWCGPSEEQLANGVTEYTVKWYFNWDGKNGTGVTIPGSSFKRDGATGSASDMQGVDQIVELTFELKDGVTLAGKEVQDGSVWPMEITFGKLAQMPSIIDDQKITLDSLGTFTIPDKANSRTLTVTGTANYISGWEKFNGTVEKEQSGHYLPIQIQLPGNLSAYGKVTISGAGDESPKVIEGFRSDDHGVELVIRLDDLVEKKFTVQYNSEPAYTINCSGITLESETGGEVKQKYIVTFESNGGTTVAPAKVEARGKVTRPTDPTKEGYTFDGWYKDSDCTEAWDFDTLITQNTTLYAKWTEKTDTNKPGGDDTDNNNPGEDNPGEDNPGEVRDEYNISISSGIRNGSVSVSHWQAEPGTWVTITVDPDKDYYVSWVRVERESSGTSFYPTSSGRRYSFTMPASDVTIDVSFRLRYAYNYNYYPSYEPVQPTVFKPTFTPLARRGLAAAWDVSAYSWAYSPAQWAYQNGYLDLAADGTFRLNDPVSHMQMWRIMAQWLGEPAMNDRDLTNWALQNGAAKGSPATSAMTRQDVVVYLHQCLFLMGGDVSSSGNLVSYADSRTITAIPIRNAWSWAVDKGIISGTADGYLNPGGTVSRGEFAAILMRLCQNA